MLSWNPFIVFILTSLPWLSDYRIIGTSSPTDGLLSLLYIFTSKYRAEHTYIDGWQKPSVYLRCHARFLGICSVSVSVPWRIPLYIFDRKDGKEKRKEEKKGKKYEGEEEGEGEQRERDKEKEAYTRQKKNSHASCAVTPRGPFRAMQYRPVVQLIGLRRYPLNISHPIALFFSPFFNVSFCASRRVFCTFCFIRSRIRLRVSHITAYERVRDV